MHKRDSTGFTIVELLIVIVVIAILATISIVAYNGIQDRANNSAMISIATQTQKLVNSYTTATGARLTAGTYCLTRDNKCATDSGATALTSDNSAIISTLQAYGSPPASTPFAAGIRTSYVTGRMVDGVMSQLFIVFWLKGNNVNCGVTTAVGSGTTWTTSTTGYSSTGGGYTQCVVPMFDPTTL